VDRPLSETDRPDGMALFREKITHGCDIAVTIGMITTKTRISYATVSLPVFFLSLTGRRVRE